MFESPTHGGIGQFTHLHPEFVQGVLDLSVSVNPLGPPSSLLDAIAHVDVRNYPDPQCASARQALGEWLDLPDERIVVGAGAAELLWALCRTLLRQSDRVVSWEPCFSEVGAASRAIGAAVVGSYWRPQASVDEALGELVRTIEQQRPRVVSFCTPTTPMGRHVPVAQVRALCERFGDVSFIVDQSFLGMSYHRQELFERLPPNAILVRSLTKELGTPGVRVGYAILPSKMMDALSAQRPTWTVSAAAQRSAELYPRHIDEVHSQVRTLLSLAASLQKELSLLGLETSPSDVPYFISRLPKADSSLVPRLLQTHKVYVRDCTSFGLPEYVRISAHPRQARLLEALAELLSVTPPARWGQLGAAK